MFNVEVFTRHAAECLKTDDRNWKKCRCPKWLYWSHEGQRFRQSAKTRSWEKAQQEARRIELKYENLRAGEKPKRDEPVTLAYAIDHYLADRKSANVGDEWYEKLEHTFKKLMLPWAAEHAIHFLAEWNLVKLGQFRATWKGADITIHKTQERVRAFFTFCVNIGWLDRSPAVGLSRIKVNSKPTDYFTDAEFAKIIDATYLYDQRAQHRDSDHATRLRTLTLLMRHSGLAIGDAVTLERDRLSNDDSLFLYRAKTGVPVFVPLPHDVGNALRNIPTGPKPNPRYFFWSGVGKKKSAVNDWKRAFRRLFDLANLKLPDGSRKRAHPHMLRDSFAVDLLLRGVQLHDVSLLLGHSSIKITEKHYAPFVKARQERLTEVVKKARAVKV